MTEKSDLKVLASALAFAAHKHRDQRHEDVEASPYINHPIALFDHLINVGDITDTDILSAALLHDTIEDTETSQRELIEEFGASISGIVDEVTDDKSLPKSERKKRQVEHAPYLSIKARPSSWLTRPAIYETSRKARLLIGHTIAARIITIGPKRLSTVFAESGRYWRQLSIGSSRKKQLSYKGGELMGNENSAPRFEVFVDDNFHYQDESERYKHGEYETYEEAVRVCKEIVDRELLHQHKKGTTASDLYLSYTSFGEDPFIRPSPEGQRFSDWEYAKQRCEEICK